MRISDFELVNETREQKTARIERDYSVADKKYGVDTVLMRGKSGNDWVRFSLTKQEYKQFKAAVKESCSL